MVISLNTDGGMTEIFVLGLMPPFRRVASHLPYKATSDCNTRKSSCRTMSMTSDMMPAGPAHAVVASLPSHRGTLRPDAVQLWLSLPVAMASECEYVVEDIPSGMKIRSDTKSSYAMLE